MATLIALLSLGIAAILQTTLVVRINLLHGAADLVLLTMLAWILHEQSERPWQWAVVAGVIVGFASELPMALTLAGYLLVTAGVQYVRSRVWQAPLLILFIATLLGSFMVLLLDYFYLWALGTPLPFGQTFNLVILPSVILNLLLAVPVYGLMGEIAKFVFPPEVEI